MIKLCNPMKNCGPRCAVLYFFPHRVPQFIIGCHKFSSGYEILAPGYKFRRWQFETPGYTRTVGGRRGLAYYIINNMYVSNVKVSLLSLLEIQFYF